MSTLTAGESADTMSMPSLPLSLRLVRGFVDRRRTPEMMAGLVSSYDSAVRIRIFGQPNTILIASPELARQVLVDGRSIIKGRVTPTAERHRRRCTHLHHRPGTAPQAPTLVQPPSTRAGWPAMPPGW